EVGRKLRLELSTREREGLERGRAAFRAAREKTLARAGSRERAVRRGESSWSIARRLGVPLWMLERLNPGRDLSRLQVGDRIKVPAAPQRARDGDSPGEG